MESYREIIKKRVAAFIQINDLSPGPVPVAMAELKEAFEQMYPDLPVTNSALGLLLGKSFVKRQQKHKGQFITVYFLNKELT